MIVLDTNILSALMRPQLDEQLVGWLRRHPESEFYLSTITVFEAKSGVARLPAGRRRAELELALRSTFEDFGDRILDFDIRAAEATAELAAKRHRRGINVDFRDAAIAGTAISRSAALATRNIRDFADLELDLLNPWSD